MRRWAGNEMEICLKPSTRPPRISNMNVAALLREDRCDWNAGRVRGIFNKEDCDKILSTSISLRPMEDGFYWVGEEKGHYSVKSCNHLLVREYQLRRWGGLDPYVEVCYSSKSEVIFLAAYVSECPYGG
ncbi:unnamed protein product [Cuscuta epithymum]|uniref:Uncharacterized protein n=1 Tax=Cuscuta epithymum TaxID=186058 RepID=A0AAV0FVV1_9ASTE|nr:unnamed protein product [Cuscuta epithymum]